MGAVIRGRRLLAMMLGSSNVVLGWCHVGDTTPSRGAICNVTGPQSSIGGCRSSDSTCLLRPINIPMLKDVRANHVPGLLMGYGSF